MRFLNKHPDGVFYFMGTTILNMIVLIIAQRKKINRLKDQVEEYESEEYLIACLQAGE